MIEARANEQSQAGQQGQAPSDAVLVARARAGDGAAVVALYQRYVREIFGFAFNQLGRVQDAEDVTSEAFLRFVGALDEFDGRASLRTWLYAIARNCVRDHWRRQQRRPETVDLDVARLAQDPGDGDDANHRATALGRVVLDRLPERYRRVLTLRILEGRSIRDTAEAMGLREGNVKVLQHRALARAVRVADELAAAGRLALAPGGALGLAHPAEAEG